MTSKEKRLLKFASIIFVIFATVQLLPMANQFGHDYWQHLQDLKAEIEKSKKLQLETQHWVEENQKAHERFSQVNAGAIEGSSSQLVGANLQKLLRELARQTGLTINTMEPPKTETDRSNRWMLVVQSMQFDADSKTLMAFLKKLDKAPKKLIVANLDVRSNRDRLNGTMQITGFSQIVENHSQ